ncbi:MAG TPA: DUF362 domain-containing protein [Bacteroidales bacterium]|nr:DUF362 domain-containing protein [Bacteroidales bacterium]
MESSKDQLIVGRRSALKMLGLSSAAMLATGFNDVAAMESREAKPKTNPVPAESRSTVAFTTGTDRKQMLYEIIKPFESELKAGLKKKQLVIKPNMVVTNVALCATHVDALRALLEYLKPIYKGQVIIAESSSSANSADGFKNYGYLDLAKEFNVKFIDLNRNEEGKPVFIIDRNLHMEEIRIGEIFADPNNYVISLSRLKTHNTVIMTGGLKNIAMGAPLFRPGNEKYKTISYKRNMHSGGSRFLHYNMYLVSQQRRPDFTIIDGVEGMEGNGPISGTPVDHKIAMAGFDVLAVDSIVAKLMDIPLENVGYLNYCAAAGMGNIDRSKIDIIGGNPDQHIRTYKLSSNIAQQMEWKDPLNLPGSNARPPQRPAQAPGQAPSSQN